MAALNFTNIVLFPLTIHKCTTISYVEGYPWTSISACLRKSIHTTQNTLSWKSKFKRFCKISVLDRMELFFYDVDDIEVILSSTKAIDKGKFYFLLSPWLNDGLLLATGNKWQVRRKLLTPTFHFNILKTFCNVFNEQGLKLSNDIDAETSKSETNVLPLITEFTLNSIAETAMGSSLESKQENVVNYKNGIYEVGEMFVNRIVRLWLHNPFIYRLLSEGKRYYNVVDNLRNFTLNIIKERRENRLKYGNKFEIESEFNTDDSKTKKRLAMLDLLLTAESEGKIDEMGIREEVDTFMFEGHDTTTVGLMYLLMLLANHPDIQERVASEIAEVFQDDDKITIDKLNQLNYTERCIKEALRLYPSVPFIGRYITEDLQLRDRVIPANIQIGVPIFDIHRDPKHFPNPTKFDPDRFLTENCITRHPFAYIPFSAGPRNCIGQKFAILEEKSVLVSILRKYKMAAITRPEDIVFCADMVLRCRDPIKIKFTTC